MDMWRICRAKYETSAFLGNGAEKTGGRWNFKGTPVVYTSENLSLATLELFVHVSPHHIPSDMLSMCVKLPETISPIEIKTSELPRNWREYPAPVELQEIGTLWLKSMRSLALLVPSAINPLENNILLNPNHPDFNKLVISEGKPFQFDPRLFRK